MGNKEFLREHDSAHLEMAGRLAAKPLPVITAGEETKEADSGSLTGDV